MVAFICPICKRERVGKRRRCYPCTAKPPGMEAREVIRQKLKGVKHTDERRIANSQAQRRKWAEGHPTGFDLAGYMHGRPHPRAREVGAERVNGIGRVSVKCEDGKWRWRARVAWEREHGPIPRGHVIHHIDWSKDNDKIENLQLVTRAEHARIHRG